jgi:hypothetical protein
MKFNDQILAGIVLNREAIQSENFSNDDGITGWRIEKTGDAYFYTVTIGGSSYTISSTGEASFSAVNVDTDITIGGDSLLAILDTFPRGCIAIGNSGTWTVDSASTSGTTALLIARFDFGTVGDDRVYRYHVEYELVGTTTNDVFRTTIRYTTDGTSPTTTSGILDGSEMHVTIPAGKRVRVTVDTEWRPGADYDVVRSAVVIARSAGTGTAYVELSDANTSMRASVEDIGQRSIATENAVLSQISKSSGAPDPDPVTTHTKTYSATWSRSWNSSGSDVYETNGTIKQGYYSGYGNGISWIGFDYSQIQTDLTGATVKKVEVYLYFWHWYYADGGTAILGWHNSSATSAPAYDDTRDAVDEKRVANWGRNVGKWVDISTDGLFTLDGWRTGVHRGIVIGTGPSTSSLYYGKAYGNTETNEPKLRITYEK